jgi:hypothetical protein
VLSVKLALTAGVLGTIVALGFVLSGSPLNIAGTNGVHAYSSIAQVSGGQKSCQPGGTLPKATSAIRVSLSANVGPQVELTVLSGSRIITKGSRAAGWGVDESITVPVKPMPRAVHNIRVCTSLGPTIEDVQINGSPVGVKAANGKVIRTVWLRMEYMRPAHKSWLSIAPSIAERIGFGRAPSGTWIVYLVGAIIIAIAALASRLILWEVR